MTTLKIDKSRINSKKCTVYMPSDSVDCQRDKLEEKGFGSIGQLKTDKKLKSTIFVSVGVKSNCN